MSDSNGSRPERDIDEQGSAVSGPRRAGLTSLQKFGVAGLMAVVFLTFIFLEGLHTRGTKNNQQEAAAPSSLGQQLQQAPLPPAPSAPMRLPQPAPTPLPRAFLTYRQPSQQETAASSPIMAFSGALQVAAPAIPAGGLPVGPIGVAKPPPRPNALEARLKPTVVEPTKAALLPHPDFLITEGTIIPCTLQTAINSELAGYVDCVIPQDIRGTTGNVVLLDKGTRVTGEIQNGLVNGQDRLFVLWDRAETPDHAVIALETPGADELGRAGLPGAVNDHFWKRFGSAILLSVIQGALNAGTALAANSGSSGSTNSLFLNSFQSNGSELSNTALQNEINIPPTLEKNQGDNVSIFVNKDLDFSDIYRLQVSNYGQ